MRIVSLSQNGSEFEWARRAEDKIARDEPDAHGCVLVRAISASFGKKDKWMM